MVGDSLGRALDPAVGRPRLDQRPTRFCIAPGRWVVADSTAVVESARRASSAAAPLFQSVESGWDIEPRSASAKWGSFRTVHGRGLASDCLFPCFGGNAPEPGSARRCHRTRAGAYPPLRFPMESCAEPDRGPVLL